MGWFVRILVGIALVGVVGFDVLSVTAAHLQTQQDANNAASDAAAAWQGSRTAPGAAAAAEDRAAQSLPRNEELVPGTFRIATDGSVSLRVHRATEHTVIAHDLGFLRHLLSFDVTGRASAPAA